MAYLTIDEQLRRTAYKRPWMKGYKDPFSSRNDNTDWRGWTKPGRWGGQTTSMLDLDQYPGQSAFARTQEQPQLPGLGDTGPFYSANTPGIGYKSFEEALAVGKQARDERDLDDYKLYAQNFGVEPTAEGLNSYMQSKGQERQSEQAAAQKNAAIARQRFEKERALRIARMDKMRQYQMAMQQRVLDERYRAASIQQRRDQANQRATTARRSSARTAQGNRMSQLMANSKAGYYSDMSKGEFQRMLSGAGVTNPLDVTQAVGGFKAWNTGVSKEDATAKAKLGDSQFDTFKNLINSGQMPMVETAAYQPGSAEALTFNQKLELNELIRDKNTEIGKDTELYDWLEAEYKRRYDREWGEEVQRRLDAFEEPNKNVQTYNDTTAIAEMKKEGWQPESIRYDVDEPAQEGSLSELWSLYGKKMDGPTDAPIFNRASDTAHPFMFETFRSGGPGEGPRDDATGYPVPLEGGDWPADYYPTGEVPPPPSPSPPPNPYGPDDQRVSGGGHGYGTADKTGWPTPLEPGDYGPPASPMDVSELPPELPTEFSGQVTGATYDAEMEAQIAARINAGETPEEIMGTPPQYTGTGMWIKGPGDWGTTASGEHLPRGKTNLHNLRQIPSAFLKMIPQAASAMAPYYTAGLMSAGDNSMKTAPILYPKQELGWFGNEKIPKQPVTREYAMETLFPLYMKDIAEKSKGYQSGEMLEKGAMRALLDNYTIVDYRDMDV